MPVPLPVRQIPVRQDFLFDCIIYSIHQKLANSYKVLHGANTVSFGSLTGYWLQNSNH